MLCTLPTLHNSYPTSRTGKHMVPHHVWAAAACKQAGQVSWASPPYPAATPQSGEGPKPCRSHAPAIPQPSWGNALSPVCFMLYLCHSGVRWSHHTLSSLCSSHSPATTGRGHSLHKKCLLATWLWRPEEIVLLGLMDHLLHKTSPLRWREVAFLPSTYRQT